MVTGESQAVSLYSSDNGVISGRREGFQAAYQAVHERRFDVFYQPVVRLDTREIVGLEALCRLLGPDGTPISSVSLEDVFSDPRLADLLTPEILRIVAKDVRGWLDAGIWFQHVGINAAPADIERGRLHDDLLDAFGDVGVPLEHVIIEVTEAVSMTDVDQVALQLNTLRDHGVRIALDDFGTGFASLTHMLSLPIDIIKLDRSFVSGMVAKGRKASLVKGVIKMANDLNLRVVAEGVETDAESSLLQLYGCNLGQGYLFARPCDRNKVTQLLLELSQRPDHIEKDGVDARPPSPWTSHRNRCVSYELRHVEDRWQVASTRGWSKEFVDQVSAVVFALKLAREANISGTTANIFYVDPQGLRHAARLEGLTAAEAVITEWAENGFMRASAASG